MLIYNTVNALFAHEEQGETELDVSLLARTMEALGWGITFYQAETSTQSVKRKLC